MGKTPKQPRALLSEHDVARIRAETMCDVGTIRRWARGDKCMPSTDLHIRRAMAKLGIESGVAA